MKRLGYYTSQFPFPQGRSAGPYAMFLQPPNASLMRVRVACVAVGHQIGQPVKPNLKMQRAQRKGCACRHRGLGDIFTPAVQDIADANTPIGYDSVTGQPIYASGADTSAPAVDAALGSNSSGAPAGSSYTYTAIFNSWVGVHFPGTDAGGSNLSTALASVGIIVDNETDQGYVSTSQNGITLRVHTTADYGSAADVKSQIDHYVYQIVGRGNPALGSKDTGMPQSSIAGGPAAAAASGVTNALISAGAPSWLAQNWGYLAAAGVGVFFLNRML